MQKKKVEDLNVHLDLFLFAYIGLPIILGIIGAILWPINFFSETVDASIVAKDIAKFIKSGGNNEYLLKNFQKEGIEIEAKNGTFVFKVNRIAFFSPLPTEYVCKNLRDFGFSTIYEEDKGVCIVRRK